MAADRGELVSLMEPLLIGDGSRHRSAPFPPGIALSPSRTAKRSMVDYQFVSPVTAKG